MYLSRARFDAAHRRTLLILTTSLLAVTALSACSSGGSGATGSATLPSATQTSTKPSDGQATSQGSTSATGGVAPSASTSPASTSHAPAPSGTQPPGSTAPITSTATFGGKITGQIDKIATVTASGSGSGQTKGPGLAITVTVHNGSSAPISLDSAVVNLAVGTAQTPGDPADGPPAKPFSGSVKPGASATGVYVFRVDQTSGPVAVTVSYSPTAPAVTFTGTSP